MSEHNSKKKVMLTTGPFHLSRLNGTSTPNNRLIVTLKNPTNKPLKASVEITIFPNYPSSITLPLIFNKREILFAFFPETTIPRESCTRWEIPIGNAAFNTIRVTTKGDYAVEDSLPVSGKLEISITGGRGAETAGVAYAGLEFADPSLFFRYENFVLCKA